MANTVIVGAQWGDEGKGKIIDYLAEEADLIVRSQGGNNAGHTVEIGDDQFILHLIPSGILNPGKICIIGNGVVLDPKAFFIELEELLERNISVKNRLFISPMCHIIMPYHRDYDKLSEMDLGSGKIGTTGRGIGPAYVDKAARRGIRLADLLDPEVFLSKLEKNLYYYNTLNEKLYGIDSYNLQTIYTEYSGYAERLKELAAPVHILIHDACVQGRKILFEGAQGTLLDIDFGTYPYVTSSNSSAGGASTGAGIGPEHIHKVIGILKAYTTRVGEGPFPTELEPDLSAKIREEGREFGATTGRARRCGWFDAVIAKYSAIVNGVTAMAVTKLDVLDIFEKIKICTAYRHKGAIITDFPSNMRILSECEPVYEEVDGWCEPTLDIRSYARLPKKARAYLSRIAELTGCPIEIISVGSKRSQTIYVSQ